MRIVWLNDRHLPTDSIAACGLCLGHFDGVHIGHRALIAELQRLNRERTIPLPLGVMCFSEPPTKYLDNPPTGQLTELDEKLKLLGEAGLDFAAIYDFPTIRHMSPEDFVKQVLLEDCNAQIAVCGFNYSFGAKGAGRPADLLRLFASGTERKLSVMDPICLAGSTVSSSLIRACLLEGKPEKAATLLGRPHALRGAVTEGKHLGRTLGLPTANLAFAPGALVPRHGVYAVQVHLDGKCYGGITNVGVRPTVEGEAVANSETFLFDFDGDLYGKSLQVDLLHFLREEQKFPSLQTLTDRIREDIRLTKQLLQK